MTTIPEVILQYRVQTNSMLRQRKYEGLSRDHWRVHKHFNTNFNHHVARLNAEFVRAQFLNTNIGQVPLRTANLLDLNAKLPGAPFSRATMNAISREIGEVNFVINPNVIVDANEAKMLQLAKKNASG